MFAFEKLAQRARDEALYPALYPPIGSLPDFTALRFTKYNQYESMILPMIKYLGASVCSSTTACGDRERGFDCPTCDRSSPSASTSSATARKTPSTSPRTTSSSSPTAATSKIPRGAARTARPCGTEIKPGGGWDVWRKIAAQDPSTAIPTSSAMTPSRPTG